MGGSEEYDDEKEEYEEDDNEEESQILAEFKRQQSPDYSISKSATLSRELEPPEITERFNEECQKLIDSIKGDLKNLSIQSKEYQKLLQCSENKNKEQISREYKEIDRLLYPHLDDPDIAFKISKKKEFRDVELPLKTQKELDNIEKESNKLCNPNIEFELDSHQKFVRNFLSFQSPYNSLLIYHGLGTGKTCSSISVCEEMRNYYQQIGSKKKIMIVASPVVQENYKIQLFDERKLKQINGMWNIKACTGNKFLKEVNPMNTKGLSKERIVKQIKKIIRESYEFLGYTEFANKINKIIKNVSGDKKKKQRQRKAIDREFSGRLLVIDEVHNIRASDMKRRTTQNLLDLVSFSRNMKLLLLTATPMFNEATEIIWLTNLMNLNDKRFPINIKDIFNKDGELIETENTHEGKNLLIQKINGYVSYVSGENPFKFPFRIFPYNFNDPHSLRILKQSEWRYPTHQINGLEITSEMQIKYLDIYLSKLVGFQDKAYKYLIKKMKEKHPELKEERSGIQYTVTDGPLQLLNIAYPHDGLIGDKASSKSDSFENELYGKRGLKRIMNFSKSKKNEFEYKDGVIEKYGRIFSSEGEDPPLKKYSSKIYQFIDRIKKSEGICLIYSNFIDGGCVPIALALEEIGITRFNKGRNLFKRPPTTPYKVNGHNAKYIMITGDKKLCPGKNNEFELKGATSHDNINGEKVKVVIISKAGTEGLDFKNIRQVHILEPWYNINRADQTIGRGVRNKSHCQLPFNKRTVEIYLYGSELQDNTMETIDMYMYRIAENKALKIGKITRLLKEHAVDCLLNKNQKQMNNNNINKSTQLVLSNNRQIEFNIGHKDNSLICDFMECEYQCKPNADLSDDIEIETYNQNFIIMNIEKILNKIRLLFREHYIYEKDDLVKRITMMKKYSREQINMALDILINDDNEFLVDMLGRNGRLINIDKFYMFQPIEFDSEAKLSMYERRHPIDFKPKKIVFRQKLSKTPEKLPTKIKIKENMVFQSLYKKYLLLTENPRNRYDKKNWSISAGNAIENLVKHNNISYEVLIELAFDHLFDVYSVKDKIKILNELETIKNNSDIISKLESNFLVFMKKTIDKLVLSIEGEVMIPLADYKRIIFSNGIGFIKLDTTKEPNIWTTDVSGMNRKFMSMLTEKYLFQNRMEIINNFIGFLTHSKNKIVFKVKSISASELKRINKGQQLPTSAENKKVTVDRLNNAILVLGSNSNEKYGMNSTKTKIETIYGEELEFTINDMELAAELELLLRYYDMNSIGDKKWFFNTLEDKINNVENIKI